MKQRNNLKQILSLLLVLNFCIFCTVPAFAAEDTDTIRIYTAEDLIDFAKQCSLDTWSQGKLVSLERDISLENTDFLPIPSFGGTFDGNGHTIRDMEIPASVSPAGLFGQLQENGTIKNLNVTGTVSPTGDAASIGGIVGENNGRVENCTFTGNISGKTNCGGIVGINAVTGIIIDSEMNGAVYGENMTGGISGYNLGQISQCKNYAYINITSVDPTISPEDIDLNFLTDFSKLSSIDTSTATNDTGGIAGYSSGMIMDCKNYSAIGYQHIGYNVGGIAGRSCGFIFNCENTAEIYGRKDVGGIVGQMEPYINMELGEDTLYKLQGQLDSLNGMVNAALEHTDAGVGTINSRLNNIADYIDSAASAAKNISTSGSVNSSVTGNGESNGNGNIKITPPQIEIGGQGETEGNVDIGIFPDSVTGDREAFAEGSIQGGLTESGVEGEANHSANRQVNADTQIQLNTSLHGLSSAINGMTGQMRLLNSEVSGTSGILNSDLKAISDQINTIGDTLSDAIFGTQQEELIEDTSLDDIDLITLGKVSNSINQGSVYGDINVGGITGNMGIEYALDPEDDIAGKISGTERRKYELKAVILNCKNETVVTAKRNYVGGICGHMDLGFITLAENYGEVKSEAGDYIGGISGITGGTIRNCFSKCTLSGDRYIGGIVGSGIDEAANGNSSTVSGCFSLVNITDYEQYIGAISGSNTGVFLENYFVSDDLAGINRLSYSGQAEPVIYEQLALLVAELKENLDIEIPSAFQTLTLRFVIDGKVVKEETFSYGASFDDSIYPELPPKEGYNVQWDLTELSDLRYDTTVTAIYTPYITALKSDALRENGRPVFYVEGQFMDSAILSAENTSIDENNLTDLEFHQSLLESWNITFSDDGCSEHTIRYLAPTDETGKIRIYVKQNEEWMQTETIPNGKYLMFSTEGTCMDVAIVNSVSLWWLWSIFVMLLLLFVGVSIWVITKNKKGKRRKRKKKYVIEKLSGKNLKKYVLFLAVLILLALSVLIGLKTLPGIMTDYRAYELLKSCMEEKEFTMELTVDAKMDEQNHSFSAIIDRTQVGDKSVTSISKDGLNLYFSDDVVFLENGTAYQLSESTTDYSQLLEQTMELYRFVDISTQGNVYCITADGEDAKEILKSVLPDVDMPAEPETVEIQLTEAQGKVSEISFFSTGTFDGTSFSVTVLLTRYFDEQSRVMLPEIVANAISSGNISTAGVLSEEVLTLVSAWMNLNHADPLSASLTVTADCGPLSIDDTFLIKRWSEQKDISYSIQKDEYAVYLRDGVVYTEDGKIITKTPDIPVDSINLLDIAYEMCMESDFQCIEEGDAVSYNISMDQDCIQTVVHSLVPEMKDMNLIFEAGTISVSVCNGSIEAVNFECSGSMDVLLTEVPVSVVAKIFPIN